MKRFAALIALIISVNFLFQSCRKDFSEDSFYIEATINGKKWKGKSTGKYTAVNSDGSQMRLFITTTPDPITSFNFFTIDPFTSSFYYSAAEFDMQDAFIAPFDSKMRFKWAT